MLWLSNGWTKPIIADVATIADTAITFVLRLMLCDIINILSSDFGGVVNPDPLYRFYCSCCFKLLSRELIDCSPTNSPVGTIRFLAVKFL